MTHTLEALGFTPFFADAFARYRDAGMVPLRVTGEHRGRWEVTGPGVEPRRAVITGLMGYHAQGRGDLPAVGDWVAAVVPEDDPDGLVIIHAILPRRGKFSRAAAGGKTVEQIVAANVDVALVVAALNGDWNPRRIERYVAAAWDGGATPVVVLSKADLCDDVPGRVAATMAVAPGADVVAVSAFEAPDLLPLRPYMEPGKTLALLGSSGAGKSTLTNALLGADRQAVQGVRSGDDRGRHTTTARQLLVAPGGFIVIDTPGMRALGRWDDSEGLDRLFADVEALAASCRFADCGHGGEPGCAVGAALATGALDAGRHAAWLKLRREEAHQARRLDEGAMRAEKARWKAVTRAQRDHYKS